MQLDSGPCLREEEWGRTSSAQHRAYVWNVTVFLFQEHLTFRKGAADPGFPACDNIKTPHRVAWSEPPREPRGLMLTLPPPCVWRIAFSQEPSWPSPWRCEVAGKVSYAQVCKKNPALGAILALSALPLADGQLGWQWGTAEARQASGVGQRGNDSSFWSGGKEGDMGPGGDLFIVVNLHNPFIKTKQCLLPSKIPPCQHSELALLPGVSTCRSGGGKDGGVEEVVMSNEYPECIKIYIFFISEKVPLRGRQP